MFVSKGHWPSSIFINPIVVSRSISCGGYLCVQYCSASTEKSQRTAKYRVYTIPELIKKLSIKKLYRVEYRIMINLPAQELFTNKAKRFQKYSGMHISIKKYTFMIYFLQIISNPAGKSGVDPPHCVWTCTVKL